jgi:hypothetical protein
VTANRWREECGVPDKKELKKGMMMLERMGVVRKVETDGEQLESDNADYMPEAQGTVFPDANAFDEPDMPHSGSAALDDTYARQYEYERRYDENTSFEDRPAPTDAERHMAVEELYDTFSMKTSGPETIYLIEEYMKSLPDTLPVESRRSIVINILNASGFDFDQLLNDGIERVGRLNSYAKQLSGITEEYVSERGAELEALDRQMKNIRGLMDKRKALYKQQFFTIETETQRINGILDFITK